MEKKKKSEEQKAANEQKMRILRKRLKRLSKEKEELKSTESYIDGLHFNLAKENYLLESEFISEVLPLKNLTPFPCTPVFITGMVNVRGKVLAVVDIKSFMDLPTSGITNLNKVIIVHHNDIEFCILADEIIGNVKIDPTTLQKNVSKKKIKSDFVIGITENMLIVLDAEKLITDDRLMINN